MSTQKNWLALKGSKRWQIIGITVLSLWVKVAYKTMFLISMSLFIMGKFDPKVKVPTKEAMLEQSWCSS
jgi:hypothetical protein